MHQSISLPLALTMAALFTGCVGNGPNTQQGAVTGGTLGAVIGGIIGNNNGHQTWQGAAIGAVAGAIAGGTLGNRIDHQQGTIYRSPEEAASNVVVHMDPGPAAAAPGGRGGHSATFAVSSLDSGLLGLQRRQLHLARRPMGNSTAQLSRLRRSILGPPRTRIRVHPRLLALA